MVMTKNSVACLFLIVLCCTSCSDDSSRSVQQSILIYPDQESENFKQFAKLCSSCHRPPMPNKHTARLWLSTVNRMQLHRAQGGLAKMTDIEKQRVLAYLQGHAQQEVQP
ncbi:hypothetical protein D8Y20_06435 [Mariprofundus sp. EBB-1]|nr:hypothetical protein D8Y20_06435 [Mariprofundus sp. EBB-1]